MGILQRHRSNGASRSSHHARRPSPLAARPRTWIAWITQPRPKARTALRWTLMISVGLHALLAPLAPHGKNTLSPDQEKMFQTEYQKKVEAAKVSRVIARELEHKMTAPLPPSDPEKVVADTLAESVTSDVAKVTSGLIDLKLQ